MPFCQCAVVQVVHGLVAYDHGLGLSCQLMWGVCSLIGGYWLAVKVLFAACSSAALQTYTYPQPHHIQAAGLSIGTSLLDLPSREPTTRTALFS